MSASAQISKMAVIYIFPSWLREKVVVSIAVVKFRLQGISFFRALVNCLRLLHPLLEKAAAKPQSPRKEERIKFRRQKLETDRENSSLA